MKFLNRLATVRLPVSRTLWNWLQSHCARNVWIKEAKFVEPEENKVSGLRCNRMIKHFWELENARFDPYIIEWNGLLNDDWQLHSLLPRIWLSRNVLCGRFCSSLEPADINYRSLPSAISFFRKASVHELQRVRMIAQCSSQLRLTYLVSATCDSTSFGRPWNAKPELVRSEILKR
jgi:hypothetical protein